MDILKKLMFWKKEDLGIKDLGKSPLPDANIGLDPNLGLGQQPGFGETPMSQPVQPSYPSFQTTPSPGFGAQQPQAFQSMRQDQQSYTIAKEIEVISSKLDALRAAIDNISQRLSNIERLAYSESQSQQGKRGYVEMPQRPY